MHSSNQYTLNVWSRGKQLVLNLVSGNIRTRGKTKLTSFPRDHTLSVLLCLDFHTAKTKKQRRRAGNNCAIVSRSEYIWIWSGTRDQESTNHSAPFFEWKSSCITIFNIVLGCIVVCNFSFRSTPWEFKQKYKQNIGRIRTCYNRFEGQAVKKELDIRTKIVYLDFLKALILPGR